MHGSGARLLSRPRDGRSSKTTGLCAAKFCQRDWLAARSGWWGKFIVEASPVLSSGSNVGVERVIQSGLSSGGP